MSFMDGNRLRLTTARKNKEVIALRDIVGGEGEFHPIFEFRQEFAKKVKSIFVHNNVCFLILYAKGVPNYSPF